MTDDMKQIYRTLDEFLGDPTPQVPEHELRMGLHELLQEACDKGGQLDPDHFWHFVAALAQGRGIEARLHERGVECREAEPQSPGNDFPDRRCRAYHRGVLARLMLDMGHEGGTRASVLPASFDAGTVTSDLLAMGANPEGIPNGDPAILRAEKHGKGTARAHARRTVVSYVYWEAARGNRSLTDVYENLPRGGLPKRTWEGWYREFGPKGGEVAQRAKEAGARGDPRPPVWPEAAGDPDKDQRSLDQLMALAKEAPGSGKEEF